MRTSKRLPQVPIVKSKKGYVVGGPGMRPLAVPTRRDAKAVRAVRQKFVALQARTATDARVLADEARRVQRAIRRR